MNAPAPRKFAFDRDFSALKNPARTPVHQDVEALVEAARQEAYAKGLADGENSAANQAARQLSNAASRLADQTATIAAQADASRKETLETAAKLAVAVGKKLAANLIARAPLAEIESLISECLASLDQVPHLLIRCHPDLADAIEKKAAEQIHTSGFDGRLIVMGDPEILLGDARLEWKDGGLVRDLANMSGAINEKLAAFIAANCPPRSTPATASSPSPETIQPETEKTR